MEGSTVFKILYEGDLRRWRVDDFVALPFPRFKEKICELYGLEDSDVTIKYTDEDGDNVTLARDRDMHEMSRQGLKTIRLTVYSTTHNSAPTEAQEASTMPSTNLPKAMSKQDKVNEKLLKALKKELKEAKAAKLPAPLKKEKKAEIKAEIKNLKNQASSAAAAAQEAPKPTAEKPPPAAPSWEDAIEGLVASWAPVLSRECPEMAAMLGGTGNVTSAIVQTLEAVKASPWGPMVTPLIQKVAAEAVAAATAGGEAAAAATAAATAASGADGGAAERAAEPGCACGPFPCAEDCAAPPKDADSGPSPSSAVHFGVSCDGCGMTPIVGPRYKAITLHDFDLCATCEAKGGEWSGEHFVCIETPSNGGWLRSMRGFRGGGGFGRFGPCGGGGFGGPAASRCGGFPGRFGGGNGLATARRACPFTPGNPPAARFGPAGPGPSALGSWKENKQAWKDARAFGKGKVMRHDVGPSGTPGMDARYVRDIALYDGTEVPAGAKITKIWRLRNTGAQPWMQDRTFLRHVGGDDLGAPRAIAVPLPEAGLAPGEEMDISVDMVAPLEPGRYVSHHRLAVEPTGPKFGQRVWAMINVVDPSAPPGSSIDKLEADRAAGAPPPPVTPAREDTVADEEDECDEEICCDPDGCCEGGNGEPKGCCGPAAAPAPSARPSAAPAPSLAPSAEVEVCCDPDGCCEGGNGEPKGCCGPAAAPPAPEAESAEVAKRVIVHVINDEDNLDEDDNDEEDDDAAVAAAAKLFLAPTATPAGGVDADADVAEASSARGLSIMKEMGFDDEELNSLLLDKHSGNVELAVAEMADRLASAPAGEDGDWDILSGSDTEPSAGGFSG